MNTQAIAAALRALADAIDSPEGQTGLPAPAASPTPPATVAVSAASVVDTTAKKTRKSKAAAAATETAAPAAAPAQAIPATGDSKVYTESDVRTALTQAQTRLGGKEKPFEILGKYSTNKVISGLAAADYAKVIAECASAA